MQAVIDNMSACAWCSNQVVTCTVYMHTIGYDNNVSPYSSNVTTCLYTCTCTGMQVCGHIPATNPAHRCNVYIILYMYTLIWSALFFAAKEGNVEIARLLVGGGANVELKDKVRW